MEQRRRRTINVVFLRHRMDPQTAGWHTFSPLRYLIHRRHVWN